MVEEVEISSFDLRYENYRVKHAATEKSLLSSILEHGIREPLQGVDTVETPESPGVRILLNGFKRYRCAQKLSLLTVPYSCLGSDEAFGLITLLKIATAFLIHAITRGHSGRFISFPELIERLYQSIGDHSQSKVIKTFASYDFLLIDELGYVEVEPAQVGLFFNLMQKRHKKKTTFITSNLGFSQWTSFLKNPQLTAALIDRLTENSYIINMKECVSLRAKLNPVQSITSIQLQQNEEEDSQCGPLPLMMK